MSKLQTKILQYLSTVDSLYCFKLVTATTAGHADIHLCYKGKFVAIEVKEKGDTQKDLQKYREQQIRDAGGVYILAESLEDVKEVIC
jgi:hypothetical protein